VIRTLTIAELGTLEACAREFYGASRFLRTFDMDRFRKVWEFLIGNGSGAIFVEESHIGQSASEITGCIGGVVNPDIYSGELVAEELFWYVRESTRGSGVRLYRRFEQWAAARGAGSLQMVHLLDSMPEKVGRFYLRAGFEPIETRYAKRLAQ
jgi:GNAT superfamily N-acetyltransferase